MKTKNIILSLLLTLALLSGSVVSMTALAADAAHQAIADTASYEVYTLDDGTPTVLIGISIEDNRDLIKIPTVCGVSKILDEEQRKLADETFRLMNVQHITGELSLHALLFEFTAGLGGAAEDSFLHSYYDSAKYADLNVDESRLPAGTCQAFGSLLIVLNTLASR